MLLSRNLPVTAASPDCTPAVDLLGPAGCRPGPAPRTIGAFVGGVAGGYNSHMGTDATPRRPPLPAAEVRALYAQADSHLEQMVAETVQLVEIESPSGQQAGLRQMADALCEAWADTGARPRQHPTEAGPHLEIRWDGPPGTPSDTAPALVVGHLDTVHPLGALDRNPVQRTDGRLHGPGTQDMKGGLAVARHAAMLLAARDEPLPRPVTVLITADEETGSLSSRQLIETLARESAYALVLEGAAPAGAVKTARKGVGIFEVEVRGRAAHAGVHFDEGVNAAVGLAEAIQQIAALTAPERGTTVNVGMARAGTAVNVVPARGSASVDVRFTQSDEAARIAQAMQSLTIDTGTIRVSGGVNRPVMERSPEIGELFRTAQHMVAGVEELTETAVGGASDGNFTAAVGTPTLDGLGPLGAGLHTDDEWLDVASLARRTGLVAAMLAAF